MRATNGRAGGMVFLFRCDGSPSLGMGHVIRCRSLAEALRAEGANVHFAMGDLPGLAQDLIRQAGFAVQQLGAGPSPEDQDLHRTVEAARCVGADWVLVDRYGPSAVYFAELKRQGLKVAVIDDMANRDLGAVDWVLNQNLGAADLPYRLQPTCERLFGPHYALLRPSFASARSARRFTPEDRRVLITFGGGDTSALCEWAIASLDHVPRRLEVRCIVSGAEPAPTLERAVATSRHEVQLIQNAPDMPTHMAWADLSINGGGSTCWELCCLGLPMITVELSPDQALVVTELERSGCGRNLGAWPLSPPASSLASWVEDLLAHPERRAGMSARAQSLVDGLGAQRAARSLLASPIAPQEATP